MRYLTAILLLLAGLDGLSAQNNLLPTQPAGAEPPMTVTEKLDYHVTRSFRPVRLAQVAAGAALLQWRDVPVEWEQGASGYAKRFGATHGFVISRRMMEFAIEAPLGLDPRYLRSTESRFAPRLKHAVRSTFFTRRDYGGTMFAVDRFGSTYGAAALATWWLPESRGTAGDALRRGTTKIGLDVANNILVEFWPDIKRKFFNKKSKIPLTGSPQQPPAGR